MNTLKPLQVELIFPVKTYDIDFAGIVSNIVFIRWLEDLRLEILKAYLPLEKQLKAGFGPILMQTQIQYKKPVTIFNKPVGRMWTSKLSKLKWFVNAEFSIDGDLVATAEQYGCFVDLSSKRPIPIPKEFVEQYRRACQ